MRLGIEAWGLGGDLLYTGMGQYTKRLICALGASDRSLNIVAYAGPLEPRPDWIPAQVDWRPVGRRLPAKLSALHSRLMVLPTLLESDGIDVFHAAAVHMRPHFPPIPRPMCRLVVTLHDAIPLSYYDIRTLPVRQRLFYRMNLRRALAAEKVVTVSQAAKQDITVTIGQPRNGIVVIPNGVDFAPNHDRRPLERLGIASPYVLYAGSYEPRKNLARAVAAFAEVIRRGAPHTLVAIVEPASGHAPAVLAEIERWRLGDRIKLVHSLDEGALRSLYTHADLLFFPSLAEGFGYPPVQAGCCGVATVATDLPAVRETMGEAAVYVNGLDVGDMAAALQRALMDLDRRHELGAMAKTRSRQFSEGGWAAAYVDLYKAVAARPEPALAPT